MKFGYLFFKGAELARGDFSVGVLEIEDNLVDRSSELSGGPVLHGGDVLSIDCGHDLLDEGDFDTAGSVEGVKLLFVGAFLCTLDVPCHVAVA